VCLQADNALVLLRRRLETTASSLNIRVTVEREQETQNFRISDSAVLEAAAATAAGIEPRAFVEILNYKIAQFNRGDPAGGVLIQTDQLSVATFETTFHLKHHHHPRLPAAHSPGMFGRLIDRRVRAGQIFTGVSSSSLGVLPSAAVGITVAAHAPAPASAAAAVAVTVAVAVAAADHDLPVVHVTPVFAAAADHGALIATAHAPAAVAAATAAPSDSVVASNSSQSPSPAKRGRAIQDRLLLFEGKTIAAVDTCGAVSGGRVLRLQTYADHHLMSATLAESCCLFMIMACVLTCNACVRI
jgi:hypothetical protein